MAMRKEGDIYFRIQIFSSYVEVLAKILKKVH